MREAMSLSLPTIVSDIPGSRDLILPGQTGLLAPAQDAKALSEAAPRDAHASRGAASDGATGS